MRFLPLLLLLLAGCATIDIHSPPPKDWPKLTVIVQDVPFDVLQRTCGIKNETVLACAIPDFDEKKCRIYVWMDTKEIMDHERLHCEGYDHPGENTMRAEWKKWKEQHG